ncbi:uncharacterized protein DAT39_002936, partial [Clarias magur]
MTVMIMDMIADTSQNRRETMRKLTGHKAAVQAMELMSSFFKHIKANDKQMSEKIRTEAVRVLMGIFLWDPEREDPIPYLVEVVDAGAEQEHSTSQRENMRQLTGPKAAARAMELMNSFFKDIEANDKQMSEKIRTEAVRVLMGIFLWDPKTGDTTPQLVLVVDAGAEGERRGTGPSKSLADNVESEAVVEAEAAVHPKNRKSKYAGTEKSRTQANPVVISGGKEKRARIGRGTCGKGRKINYNMVQDHRPGMLKEEDQGARAEVINQFLKALLVQEKEKLGNETRILKELDDGMEAKAEKDEAEETEAENSITLAIINMHDNSAKNTGKGTEKKKQTRRGTRGKGRKIHYRTFQDKKRGKKEEEDGARAEAINFVLKVLQEAQNFTMSLDEPISNIHDEPANNPGTGHQKKKRTRRGTRGKGRKIHYKKSQDRKSAMLKEEDDGARTEAINLVLKVLQEAQKITMSLGGGIANMHDKPAKNPGIEHQRKKWTRRGTRGKGRKIHYTKFQDKKS